MGNSSSNVRRQSSSSNRPSSAAMAKKTAGKDQLPPMTNDAATVVGRKNATNTTTTSPSVSVPTNMMGQGTDVPVTMDEPHLTAVSSSEEEDEEDISSSKNNNNNNIGTGVVEPVVHVTFDDMSVDSDDDDDDDEDDDESLDEYWAERVAILADAKALSQVASWYFHPERPVTVDDPTCTGRSYYGRASAPDHLDAEDVAARDAVLADMAALKTWAGCYAHPERPVAVDSTATGRNYFTRPSATEYNDEEVERDMILKEAVMLKEVAGWYKHPERPVKTSDPVATGHNYFSRMSAPEYNDEEVEMDLILKEAAQLKQLAGWYKHPERPVECTDPCATARNYFTRASAPGPEDDEDMSAERDQVLADIAELKKVASWYMHPERPVDVDPASFGRNYFSRPTADDYDDQDDAEERERILADAAKLKKVATWYLHPEKPVVVSDPCAPGRNYFTRPSAPHYEDFEEEYQRDMVLSDVAELKQLAMDYRHPEKGVVTTDPFATGRNYFSRPSAAPTAAMDDEQERTRALQDAVALKKLAVDYLHPEIPVVTSVAVGRDFFSRPSAPAYEDDEVDNERDTVLADAKKLKELANWYHHPEVGVKSSVAVARNYFTRPSAAEEDAVTPDEEEERARILADVAALKKLAVDYAHPEKPVVSNVNCVRNYFDRPSAEGHADYIHSQGHALEDGHVDDEHHNFDFHQYHYYDQHHHHHDDDHSHVSRQSDHFEMDEDMFHGFRESLYQAHAVQEQVVPIIKEDKEGEEGKLSRSPSSVMLFDEM